MKKIFTGIALLAIAAISFSASADCKKDACKDAKKDCQKECKKTEKCDKEAVKAACPFAGIDLTAEQKAKLEDLKAECKAERSEKMAADKAKIKADRREMRKARLEKIKEILTPEQYVKFLENKALSEGHQGKGSKMQAGRRHDMKADKATMKSGERLTPRYDGKKPGMQRGLRQPDAQPQSATK